MQHFAHERGCSMFSISLESAQIHPLILGSAAAEFCDSTHTLATSVIDIPCALAILLCAILIGDIHHLALCHLKLTFKIPLHDLQVRHTQHVAMSVIAVVTVA